MPVIQGVDSNTVVVSGDVELANGVMVFASAFLAAPLFGASIVVASFHKQLVSAAVIPHKPDRHTIVLPHNSAPSRHIPCRSVRRTDCRPF
jgi:hypothetical protein